MQIEFGKSLVATCIQYLTVKAAVAFVGGFGVHTFRREVGSRSSMSIGAALHEDALGKKERLAKANGIYMFSFWLWLDGAFA